MAQSKVVPYCYGHITYRVLCSKGMKPRFRFRYRGWLGVKQCHTVPLDDGLDVPSHFSSFCPS